MSESPQRLNRYGWQLLTDLRVELGLCIACGESDDTGLSLCSGCRKVAAAIERGATVEEAMKLGKPSAA